jgi:hypothetical protein
METTMLKDSSPLLSKVENGASNESIYLSNLNLNYFKMCEAMGLKIIALRSPSMGHQPAKFHKNLPIGSKVDSRTADLQTARFWEELIRILSLRKTFI